MPGYRALARNRDFTVLWIGETVSELGTSLTLFALPLVAYALSGSAVTTALVEAAYLTGMCALMLPAGVIADRFDRRRVMLVCSAWGLAAFGSLAVAGAAGALTLGHLVLASVVGGGAAGAMGPALTASIRTVVATEDLPTALSQNQARQHVASLVGGPLGGALYAATRWLPFAADALTFAVSLATVGRLRTDLSARGRPGRGWWLPMAEGFGFVRERAFFRVLIVWGALANVVVNALFFVVVVRMIAAGVPPTLIGLFSTAAGVGGLLGAAVAPYVIERVPTGWLAVAVAWMGCLPLIPLVWWSGPVAASAGIFLLLLVNPAGNAGLGAYRMAVTPDELQGRVGSALQFSTMALMPLSPVIGGVLLEHTSGSAAVAALVLATALLAVLLSSSRSIRSVPRPRDWPREESSVPVSAAG